MISGLIIAVALAGTSPLDEAARALAAEFRDFRRGQTLGGLDPKALIREGLR